ncbi:MAG: esterase/lipase family protein, partial [Microcystis sp.]
MNPVVLVHGFLDTTAVFKPMSEYLNYHGWQVHSFNLIPNHGYEKLEVLASQVENYIEKNFAKEQKVDLIGFSMGGLITRYYLQRLGGVERVQRYLNISAPNRGTLTAYSLPL